MADELKVGKTALNSNKSVDVSQGEQHREGQGVSGAVVNPSQVAAQPPPKNFISAGGVRDPMAQPVTAPSVSIPDLVLTDKQKEKFYTGRIRHLTANIGSAQHIEVLEREQPWTAKALFRFWAESGDVLWEVMHNLEAEGVGPTDPGFRTAVQAAFNQRTAPSQAQRQNIHDSGRRGADTRRAQALARTLQAPGSTNFSAAFVTRVLPALYTRMSEENIALVDRLTAEYGLSIAQEDDAYKALVGFAIVAERGELEGLRLTDEMYERVRHDGAVLSGALGYGLKSFKASFDVKNREARDRAVAVAFGETMVAAGIRPAELELEI